MSTIKVKIQAITELEKDGRVTPESVVQAARDRTHPLHGDFVWDDKKAAHQHRLSIARHIIASVRVIITTETRRINTVAYVRDPAAEREQGYVSVVQLRTERENAEAALNAELTRLQSALERVKELARALELDEGIDVAIEGVMSLASRLRRGSAEAASSVQLVN